MKAILLFSIGVSAVACSSGVDGGSAGYGNGGAAGNAASGATGGSSTGGSATGGTATGGSATGGTATGGSATGGTATGGTATGGSATGGSATGGSGGTGGSAVVSYTTDFDLTESPISEGGAWKQLGVDWTHVVTAGGLAYGTQTGGGGFDDSYAYLSAAFPPNQSASAVIHLESGIGASYEEVEILLRWTDSAHNSTGYECNLAYNGQYAEIIKWPGPLGTQKGQYTFISSGNPVSGGVHDGDVFQADVIGNVITVRLNGNVIATGTDSSITAGSPGIGFYSEGAPASRKFSFSRFTATGL